VAEPIFVPHFLCGLPHFVWTGTFCAGLLILCGLPYGIVFGLPTLLIARMPQAVRTATFSSNCQIFVRTVT
jgi:hypothetical protein